MKIGVDHKPDMVHTQQANPLSLPFSVLVGYSRLRKGWMYFLGCHQEDIYLCCLCVKSFWLEQKNKSTVQNVTFLCMNVHEKKWEGGGRDPQRERTRKSEKCIIKYIKGILLFVKTKIKHMVLITCLMIKQKYTHSPGSSEFIRVLNDKLTYTFFVADNSNCKPFVQLNVCNLLLTIVSVSSQYCLQVPSLMPAFTSDF